MNDIDLLKQKIEELERRVSSIETDKVFMDALYLKACEFVENKEKVSVLFLQKKFLIDIERATELMERLKSGGVYGNDS